MLYMQAQNGLLYISRDVSELLNMSDPKQYVTTQDMQGLSYRLAMHSGKLGKLFAIHLAADELVDAFEILSQSLYP